MRGGSSFARYAKALVEEPRLFHLIDAFQHFEALPKGSPPVDASGSIRELHSQSSKVEYITAKLLAHSRRPFL
jgi:hypothetical protein